MGVKVSEARIGISTNTPQLVDKEKFFWLDTNFFSVDEIPFKKARDSFVEIVDVGGIPTMEAEGDLLRLTGPFSQLEEESLDKRFSLFGNLGVFSSWVLKTLEEKHGIFTFHACALVREDKFLVILGGAGAGKTVFILSSLKKGWRLFSTEFVHFRVKGGVTFFKGSVKDPVRVDTLINHFLWAKEEFRVNTADSVGGKSLVDLSSYQTQEYQYTNPDVILVVPHIEEKRRDVVHKDVDDRGAFLRTLFHNISDKISKSTLLYREFAIPGLDSANLVQKRTENIRNLLRSGVIKKSIIWVSGIDEVKGFFDRLDPEKTKELQ